MRRAVDSRICDLQDLDGGIVGKKRKTRISPSHRLQLVALAALTAVTLGVVGFVFLRPAPVATASGSVAFTPPPSTPTASPTAVDSAPTLAAVKGLLAGAEPLTISVLGDSTGNASGEWVDLWAQSLTKYGTVTLHLWDAKADDWNQKVLTYPGPARPITIWNGSKSGSTHLYALQFIDKIQPEKPAFQILNYGHNNLSLRADGGSADLMRGLAAKWASDVPTVVTLQNPAVGARASQSAASVFHLRDWAARKGHPVIDVENAFNNAGNLPSLILEDGLGVHPNPAGSRIWADTVTATLG